jgi:hypothetical protein
LEGAGDTLDTEETGATIYHRGSNVHAVLGAVGDVGTGITNAAANTELPQSDGTNLIASGIFVDGTGNINAGTGLSGADRFIQAAGSASNIGMGIYGKGTGYAFINGGGIAIRADANGSTLGGNVSMATLGPNFRGLTSGVFMTTGNAAPSAAPADGIFLYVKDVAGVAHLFAMGENGVEHQLTGV